MKARSTGRKDRLLPLHRVYCSNCWWRGRIRMQPITNGIRLDVSERPCPACGHLAVCIDISPRRYRNPNLRIRSTTHTFHHHESDWSPRESET